MSHELLLCAGICTLPQLQAHARNQKRSAKFKATTFKNYADLLNYVEDHKLPDTFAEMTPFELYAVDKLAQDFERFPNTMATVLMSRVTVGWIGQLVKLGRPWALHADATHKFHIGGWALTTFGTHCLLWDALAKVLFVYGKYYILIMHYYPLLYDTYAHTSMQAICIQVLMYTHALFYGVYASRGLCNYMCPLLHALLCIVMHAYVSPSLCNIIQISPYTILCIAHVSLYEQLIMHSYLSDTLCI